MPSGYAMPPSCQSGGVCGPLPATRPKRHSCSFSNQWLSGLEERIHKGFKVAVVMASIFCIFISALVFIFADKLMLIFIESSKSEIIYQGAQYLRIEGACYLGIGCLFLLYGYYRGVGKPGISVVLTVISLGTRVVLAYLLAPLFGTLAIWWAIPIGWFLADLIGIMYGLKKERWTNRYIDK